jgi:hypothetical protein
MPSFDAGSIVEPIHVRLIPYAQFDEDVREPSDKQLGEFLSALKKLMGSGALAAIGIEGGLIDTTDPDAMLKAVNDLEPAKFVEVMTDLADMHSKLCSGKPSKAQILAVPIRRRFALFAYLQGEVMSPEPAPADGGPQLVTLPRAAGL